MAKHVTKSVIEDIAYQFKRVGLITKAYEDGTQTPYMIDNFGEELDTSGTSTVKWLVSNLEDVFAQHDPTFDAERWRQQAAFSIEI